MNFVIKERKKEYENSVINFEEQMPWKSHISYFHPFQKNKKIRAIPDIIPHFPLWMTRDNVLPEYKWTIEENPLKIRVLSRDGQLAQTCQSNDLLKIKKMSGAKSMYPYGVVVTVAVREMVIEKRQ